MYKDGATVRGKLAPKQPILRVWVWNNTDQPLRLEPSAFRFVEGGVEMARNNSAKSSIYPISSTVVAPRTVYVGDMVMNVRTGKRYADDYALIYNSSRPEKTIVLNRYMYWKNSMSTDEYLRTAGKQEAFRKVVFAEQKRLGVNDARELYELGGFDGLKGFEKDKHDPNIALRNIAQKIFGGRAQTMAGLWEMQVAWVGNLSIPSYLQGGIKKIEPVASQMLDKSPPITSGPNLGGELTEADAGALEEAKEGYFVGTAHRRGAFLSVVQTATPESNLGHLYKIDGIRLRSQEDFTPVHTWSDVADFLKDHANETEVIVEGTNSKGRDFSAIVKINRNALSG